jgi:hypothetical protein
MMLIAKLSRNSIYWALEDMMPVGRILSPAETAIRIVKAKELTLDVRNALLEDLLENLGALELLLDLANDAVGKLTLLALLNLALVADPRVKDLLGLGRKSGALLELVGLSLELGGFLYER